MKWFLKDNFRALDNYNYSSEKYPIKQQDQMNASPRDISPALIPTWWSTPDPGI